MTLIPPISSRSNNSGRRGFQALECGLRPLRVVGGFTLLELLTVIVVVGILAAFLSTALGRARGKAHRISCVNNQRQLQIAWFLYSDENEDRLPLNRTVASGLNPKVFGRRSTTNSWVAGNPKEDVTTENIKAGTLYPYTRSVAVYRCPADQSKVIGKENVLRTRSYSMSAYLNGDAEGVDPRVKKKYGELVNPPPSEVFVFIEEHEYSPWNGAFALAPKERFSLSSSANWISVPSDRHDRGCNLSFADGHVEYWRWFSPKVATSKAKSAFHPRQQLDLKRLQEAIPR